MVIILVFFLVGRQFFITFSKRVLGSNANSNHFSKNQLYIKQANVYQVQVQLKARKTFLKRVRAHDSIWKEETFFLKKSEYTFFFERRQQYQNRGCIFPSKAFKIDFRSVNKTLQEKKKMLYMPTQSHTIHWKVVKTHHVVWRRVSLFKAFWL